MSGTGSDVRRAYPGGPQDQYGGGGGYGAPRGSMPPHRDLDRQQQQQQQRGLPPASNTYSQQQQMQSRGAHVDRRAYGHMAYGDTQQGMHQQSSGGRGRESVGGGAVGAHGGRQQPGQQQGGMSGFVAPTTGQMRSGHIEVDSLYGSGDGNKGLTVNAMNAPNNSTMQCGCENIDCPFCNQMMSIQMSDQY